MTDYYDIENVQDREFPITEADLKREYELNCDLILGFEDEYPSFNAWLKECCSKNGTLERVYTNENQN